MAQARCYIIGNLIENTSSHEQLTLERLFPFSMEEQKVFFTLASAKHYYSVKAIATKSPTETHTPAFFSVDLDADILKNLKKEESELDDGSKTIWANVETVDIQSVASIEVCPLKGPPKEFRINKAFLELGLDKSIIRYVEAWNNSANKTTDAKMLAVIRTYNKFGFSFFHNHTKEAEELEKMILTASPTRDILKMIRKQLFESPKAMEIFKGDYAAALRVLLTKIELEIARPAKVPVRIAPNHR